MAKKKTTEKALNIDNILFNCRDYLRAARNSGSFFEKRDMMLTLVFLRFIGEKYEDGIENLKQTLKEQGLDPEDENIRAAFFDDATFADGTYNLPPEARWSTIISTPAPQLNVALDTALQRLEEEDPQLKGCFVKGTFTARNLAANDIKKIVDEVNKISHKTFGEEKDLIGRVYEYFLKEFAVNATKEEGEFYTPHDVVQLIATMIEPYDGTLYDPCCGSGGMFIQSAELVKSKQGNLNGINVYGQEKEPATYRLAKMNLALRGISHNLGEEADSSFTHDLHKGLHFNYIMANPPFNLKGWYNDNLKNDGRWSDYQTPPESNANYAWILHILSHLKKTDGVAGFLLANGALNDSDTLEIRKELIQNDKIEAIVVLPRELFITTDISVTLWILNQNKKGGKYHGRNLRNREHEMLFMDLRQWTENAVKGESKKKVRLDTEQIEKAADIYHTWQCEGTDGADYEMPELYRSVCINEIENKGWALTPSKYIEFIDHDLEIDYIGIRDNMREAMKVYGGDTSVAPTSDDVEQATSVFREELEVLKNMFTGYDLSPFLNPECDPIERYRLLAKAAEYVFVSTEELQSEGNKGVQKVSFKTYFLKTVKRMRAAFDICQPSGYLGEEESALAQCFMAIAGFVRKMSGTSEVDTDTMNRAVSKMVEEALKYNQVESVLESGEEEDIFSPEYFEKLSDVKMPATKLELLVKMLRKQIKEYGKVNQLAAKSFQEMLEKTIAEYHERRKHLTAEEAGEAQEQVSEDIIKIATEQALAILRAMDENRESFRKIGLTFEEKAFYDILISMRDQYNFEYGTDKEVDGIVINDKCKNLAIKVKEIIDTKSSFADWLNNQNVRDQLKLEIKICLVKNGYPPQYSPEVFKKVMEQVENFEEYSSETVEKGNNASAKIYQYEMPEGNVMMVAEETTPYGKL